MMPEEARFHNAAPGTRLAVKKASVYSSARRT
jgi:hypothetical protein